jgi:hypothetical protein
MQWKEKIALVAGATVGVGGGALGAFLTCIAGGAAVRRFLDQFGDQDIELRQPAPPAARHRAQQPSLGSASTAQPTRDQSLPQADAVGSAASASRR